MWQVSSGKNISVKANTSLLRSPLELGINEEDSRLREPGFESWAAMSNLAQGNPSLNNYVWVIAIVGIYKD